MRKKQPLTPRRVLMKLTSWFFAAYAAYNIFVLVKDSKTLPPEGKYICITVAVMFAVLTIFARTSDERDIRFLLIRKTAFVIVMLVIFALKMRMVFKVNEYLGHSKPYTWMYGAAYWMTQAGLLILIVYYAFLLKRISFYPKLCVIVPLIAAILFTASLVLEMIIFYGYGVVLEGSKLRTAVVIPVFYLGFIGMSVYFMFPPMTVVPDAPI